MKKGSFNKNRDSILRLSMIALGIIADAGLGFFASKLPLPLFLDTVGTLGVAASCGVLPGMITAVLSNLLSCVYDSEAVFFGVVNALIAMYTTYAVSKRDLFRLKNAIRHILIISAISVTAGSIIQWGLIGEPHLPFITEVIDAITKATGLPRPMAFLGFNYAVNIVDKTITLSLALLWIHYIPVSVHKRIYDGGWRQRPLTAEEKRMIPSDG